MPLKIIRNDITKVEADAIVNPANPLPCIGAGTDAAIHAAAGPALLEARRAIGSIAVGDCAATPAFGLPAKYVLHAVSPGWAGGQAGEAELLRKTYDAALLLAGRLHCESVAFPLLAAGSYGFPHAVALSVAHDSHNIICVGVNNDEMYAAIQALIEQEGGFVLVEDGKVIASLPLPIAGLMSDLPGEEVAVRLKALHDTAYERLGVSRDVEPIMTLCFMSLIVIPSLKISTRGLFDVTKFDFVPLEAD